MQTTESRIQRVRFLWSLKRALMGRRIVNVQLMTAAELRCFGWWSEEPAILITLDDGTQLVPLADEEGNGPGHLQITKG